MDGLTLRPARASDFAAIGAEMPSMRVRAVTLVRGDEVMAVGGIVFLPGGHHAVFCQAKPDARRYRVAYHKAGLALIALARNLGIRQLLAKADPQIVRSAAWLARLGFTEIIINNEQVWVWEHSPSPR